MINITFDSLIILKATNLIKKLLDLIMRKEKITKKFIDTVDIPDKGKAVIYKDTVIQGFGLKVTPTKKAFIVDKRVNGKLTRKVFGQYPPMTVDQARIEAIQLLAKINIGSSVYQSTIDVSKLTLAQSYADMTTNKTLTQKTKRNYDSIIRTHLSIWANIKLKDIKRDMIIALNKKLSETMPAQANAVMRLLRSIYNFAKSQYRTSDGEQSLFPDNPVDIIKEQKQSNKLERRQSHITVEDLPKWYSAVQSIQSEVKNNHDTTRDFLVLLLFTGLRKEEGASITWDNVDLKKKVLTIPNTKNKTTHRLPITPFLSDLLTRRQKEGLHHLYVFPNITGDSYIKECRRFCKQVTKESGVKFILHDLRRTFSTIAQYEVKVDFYTVKKLLNHRQSGDVTFGYIVDTVEALRPAMEKISKTICKKSS